VQCRGGKGHVYKFDFPPYVMYLTSVAAHELRDGKDYSCQQVLATIEMYVINRFWRKKALVILVSFHITRFRCWKMLRIDQMEVGEKANERRLMLVRFIE